MSSLIKLQNIRKQYAGISQNKPALNNISLTIDAGEAIAITGASGSGKSTLLNILGLLDQAVSGQYFLLGNDVIQLSPDDRSQLRNQTIGFVFQAFFLLPRLSALENIMLPLLYSRVKRSAAQEKAYDLLEKIGMSAWMQHMPTQLSGGQQQRIAIARALARDPAIILADEPTGALDSENSGMIMDMLFELNRARNTTLLVVTHDTQVYNRFPRVVTLSDGRLQ